MPYQISYRIHHNHTPERIIEVQASPEQTEAFVKNGYLVFERFFSPAQTHRLRDALDAVAADEGHSARSGKDWGGIYLRHLMEKHEAFLEMFRLEPFLSLARATLGPQVQVLPMTGRIALPDDDGQATPWHIHQRVVPTPRPPFFSPPHVLDALIYLDDIGDDSGPLCMVPGSHLWEDREFPGGPHDDIEGQVLVRVPAGSVVLIHGNLWHRALPTTPGGDVRRLLILPYTHAWTQLPSFGERPRNGLMAPLFDSPDPVTREMLGIPEGIY
jgi:ectoine hydroxylase-related dioxygenase (phytanoyl-CoA dioxygenase family)